MHCTGLRSAIHVSMQPAVTSCRSPVRPTCPIACCARSRSRRSIIAAPSSPRSGSEVLARPEEGLPDAPAGGDLSRPRAPARGKRRSSTRCRPATGVLTFEIGEFARLWAEVARAARARGRGRRRRLAPAASIPASVEARSGADREHRIRALLVVHNETSTGATSRLPEIRRAIDRGAHPALLLVDAVSSLASIELRHDEWGIDVTLAGSQKGLMLPPGLSFNAISEKALAASRTARPAAVVLVVGADARDQSRRASSPTQPSTNLLYGLREALADAARGRARNVFARHIRLAAAARAAVRAWELEIACAPPGRIQPRGDDGDGARRSTTRTAPSRSRWSASTCRSAPGSAGSRAARSASVTSATSTN